MLHLPVDLLIIIFNQCNLKSSRLICKTTMALTFNKYLNHMSDICETEIKNHFNPKDIKSIMYTSNTGNEYRNLKNKYPNISESELSVRLRNHIINHIRNRVDFIHKCKIIMSRITLLRTNLTDNLIHLYNPFINLVYIHNILKSKCIDMFKYYQLGLYSKGNMFNETYQKLLSMNIAIGHHLTYNAEEDIKKLHAKELYLNVLNYLKNLK